MSLHFRSQGARVVAVLFLAAYVILGVLQLRMYWRGSSGSDHFIYSTAVARAWGGGNPYEPHNIGWGYFYPPPSILLLRAIDGASPPGLTPTWLWLGAASTAAAILLLFGAPRTFDKWWAAILLLASAGSIESSYIGQINGFVVLLVVGFLQAWQKDRSSLAGALLAGATGLKFTPLVFVVVLLRDRDWRALTSFAATLLVLSVAAEILIPGPWLLPECLRAMTWAAGQFAYAGVNYSLSVVIPLLSQRWLHIGVDWQLVHLIKLATLAGLLGVALVIQGADVRKSGQAPIVLLICNVAMALAPNLFWLHHEVLLIPAYWWLLTAVPQPTATVLAAGSLLSFQTVRLLKDPLAVSALASGLLLVACIVVLVGTATNRRSAAPSLR